MRNLAQIAALMLLCALLSAAGLAQQSATSAPEMAKTSDDAAYVIGPEDVLQVNVWKEAEFSGSFPVRPDGKISIALLHDVQAAGLTPTQLSQDLTEKLKKYLDAPRVTVIVSTINSRRVYLMGMVGRPGAMPLQGKMTVLQAISNAGGLQQFADAKKIYVLRTENGKQVKMMFNYKEVIKGKNPEQNFILQPGDTIVVP